MGEEITSNSYEEARKRQVLENKKRFEDLGILNISKSLSDLSKSEKKSKQQREAKPKIRNAPLIEPRRSTRTRSPIITYQDEVNVDFPTVRRRSKSKSSWESYLVRPVEEVKLASYEDRVKAMKSAEKLRSNLQSEHPSFVKSMDRSHVYSCFWLGLPETICNTYLPKSTVRMMLENEDGNEYECVFISERAGLSAGWRAFALEHKLDDGDALVFELIEQTRFKIYIVRVSGGGSQDDDDDMSNVDEEAAETKKTTRPAKNLKKSPGNGRKLTAKIRGLKTDGGSEVDDDDDHMSNVNTAAAETKKISRPTKKLQKTPRNVRKLTAKNNSLATDGRSRDNMSNVNKAIAETNKTSRPTKMLKNTTDSPPETGKKPAAKKSEQCNKPNKSVEVATGTRRSTRNRN